MQRQPRNVVASVRQRLVNHAMEVGADPNLVLIWYGIERLLYRISMSPYAEQFVLKGAMLFRLWRVDGFRATKDLDLLGFLAAESETVRTVFQSICAHSSPDDGLIFDPASVRVSEIREHQAYAGLDVSVRANLGTARIALQVDVGFGDAITPSARLVQYPTILESAPVRIRAYPQETVIAEKVEAMVSLGARNTRMKDFFDVWFMSQRFEIDGADLARAIRATFDRRGTQIPTETPIALTQEFARDAKHLSQWAGFLDRSGLRATGVPDLSTVIHAVGDFVLAPVAAAADRGRLPAHWTPSRGWIKAT